MCKLFALTDASGIHVTDKLMDTLRQYLCVMDKDGFGYSVQGEKGVFGERTLDATHSFKSRLGIKNKTRDLSFVEKRSNGFGVRSKVMGSLMAHGRMSTNHVSLPCTHPYVDAGVSLIHNGVVNDMSLDKIKCETLNDTEICLRYWQKSGIDGIVENVGGYYALIIQEDGRTHILRDDRAQLVVAWVETIGSFMFATNEGIIQGVCKSMKWKHDLVEKVRDNCYLVFERNELVYESSISPKKAMIDQALVTRSLGYESSPSLTYDAYEFNDDGPVWQPEKRYPYSDYDDGSVDLVAEAKKYVEKQRPAAKKPHSIKKVG